MKDNDSYKGLPLNDERYRIPGTNTFSLSRWSLENIPQPPAKLQVGETAWLLIETGVTKIYPDCDGTPLYATHNGNGWSDTSLMSIADLAERMKYWADNDGTPAGLQRLIERGWDVDDEHGY